METWEVVGMPEDDLDARVASARVKHNAAVSRNAFLEAHNEAMQT